MTSQKGNRLGKTWQMMALTALCGLALSVAATSTAHGATSIGRFRYVQATTSFTDQTLTTIPAFIFYPTAYENGRPLAPETKFPAVVFMQGGNAAADRYLWLGRLAQHGYIVIIPDKPRTEGVVLLTTVDILDKAVKHLRALSNNPASFLAGRFANQVAVSGHSFGGFVSIVSIDPLGCLAHAQAALAQCPPAYMPDPALKAMWLLAGHHQTYDPLPDSALGKAANFPVYLMAGSLDGLAPPEDVTATYRRYAQPKQYYQIEGANHFQWTSYTIAGDRTDEDGVATISRATQEKLSLDAARRFMECNLKGQAGMCANVPTTPVS